MNNFRTFLLEASFTKNWRVGDEVRVVNTKGCPYKECMGLVGKIILIDEEEKRNHPDIQKPFKVKFPQIYDGLEYISHWFRADNLVNITRKQKKIKEILS